MMERPNGRTPAEDKLLREMEAQMARKEEKMPAGFWIGAFMAMLVVSAVVSFAGTILFILVAIGRWIWSLA